MATPSSSATAPRPLLAALAFAGVAVIGGLAWYAVHLTREAEASAAARAAIRPMPPPTLNGPLPPPVRPATPEVPYNALVVTPTPAVAPPLSLPTLDGATFDLARAKGQVVFVNFWATWCPPCAKEMPSMVALGQALTKKYPGKFRMVAVSVDEQPQAVREFFARPPYGGPPRDVTVALEPGAGQVTRAYYCAGRGACSPEDVKFPETYIVDRQGRIVAFVVGDIDWSHPEAVSYLESLIRG